MESFYQQLLNLLTNPPANLLYHLVLAFAVISALQNVSIFPSRTSRLTGRLNFGLTLLLVAQGLLFLLSALSWQNLVDPRLALLPIDRALTVFVLIWAVWLWLTPSHSPAADLAAGISSVIVVIAGLLGFFQWKAVATSMTFNQSPLNLGWELLALAAVLSGIALLILKRPAGWGAAIAFFTIQLIGHTVQLIWPVPSSDFAGAVRLAQVCSYPLLPILASRLPNLNDSASARTLGETLRISEAYPEQPRQKTDPRVVTAWVELASRTGSEKAASTLTRAIAHTLLAELCYLVTPTATGELALHSGYDLIRAEDAPGSTIPAGQAPALMAALNKNRALRLGVETTSPDLLGIGQALNLNPVGCMLFIPLGQSAKAWGGLLLLTPYSNREWSADEQSYLMTEAPALLKILQSSASQTSRDGESDLLQGEVERLQTELTAIKQEYQLVLTALDDLRQGAADAGDVEALLSLQKDQQLLLNNLQAENQRLNSALNETRAAPAASPRLENELQGALREIAELESRLDDAQRKLEETRQFKSSTGLSADEEREIVGIVVQELRQPMASIIGYTDLLLTESAGILGPLQRKFLERVKASNEKLRSLLDDLVHVMALRGGPFEMIAEPVQLGEVLDKAITNTSAQFREKNISLQIDLPEEMPDIHADRDGLHQIFVHLLQNAGTVTPNEGSLSLSAVVRQTPGSPASILFQVTDSGSGISAEDLPQVFSRRYRTTDVLIQGVGDTGVGLSIVKALVEAHGGRIWVESSSQGTTFFVELPLQKVEQTD
jgi:signal transduction histidine kinase